MIVNVVVKTIPLSGTGRKMGLIIGNHGVSFLATQSEYFPVLELKSTTRRINP